MRVTRFVIVLMVVGTGLVTLGAQDRRLPDASSQPARRVALTIGNDAYPAARLKNARNDATVVAGALRELGFIVTTVEDAGRMALTQAVTRFSADLRADDVAFFYYAGHGVQVEGENYLIPIDSGMDASEVAVRMNGIRASEVQQALRRARVSVLVLDACRVNPFAGARSGAGGLAPIEAKGSLVAYATGANQVASDNSSGANGLFTGELVRLLRTPGLSIREVFYQVRQKVFDLSGGNQFPAVYDQLLSDFVLRPGSASPSQPPAVQPIAIVPPPTAANVSLQAELALWDAVRSTSDPALLDDFLRRYPNTQFRPVAEGKIKEMRGAEDLRRAEAKYGTEGAAAAGKRLAAASLWADSAEAYKVARLRKPDDRDIVYGLADAYWRLGKWADAEEPWRRMTELEPTNAWWRRDVAYILSRLGGRNTESETEYRRAIAMDSTQAAWHSELASVLENQRKLTEAEAELRSALRLQKQPVAAGGRSGGAAPAIDPAGAVGAYGLLGSFLERQKRYSDAETSYSAAANEFDANAAAHQNLAAYFARRYKWQASEAEYRKAVKADPSNPNLHYSMALALGLQSEARSEFEEALRLGTGSTVASAQTETSRRCRFAEYLIDVGRKDDARPQLTAVGGYPAFCVLHSELYTRLGDDRQAEAAARAYVPVASPPPYGRLRLSWVLHAIGKDAEADREFQSVIADLSPDYEYGFANYLLQHDFKTSVAHSLLQKLIGRTPGTQSSLWLEALGWSYLKSGNLDEAERNLKAAEELDLQDRGLVRASIEQRLAELYERRGQKGLAVAALTKALSAVVPHSKVWNDIKQKLGTLGPGE